MPMFQDQRRRDFRGLRLSSSVIACVLVVIGLALCSVFMREPASGTLHGVQSAAGSVFSPLQYAGAAIAYAEGQAEDALVNATTSEATYTQLLEENQQLKSQLIQMEEYRQEAIRLEGLLNMQDFYNIQGPTGRVVGISTDSWNRVVTVDLGSNDGVALGSCAVSSYGLLGQVVSVGPTTCKVRLITDSQSGVSCYLQGSREVGVLVGSIEGLTYLQQVNLEAAVEVGDTVVTSGLGGVYPEGLVVGTVTAVNGSAGTSERTIVVTPLCSTGSFSEVTIVSGVVVDSEGEE